MLPLNIMTKQESLGKAILELKLANPGMTVAQAADTVYLANSFGVVTNGNGHVAYGKL